MRKWIIASTLILSCAGPVTAADRPASAETCAACHGANGVSSNPEWPNLAGQHQEYLAIQIRAFRDGIRDNPPMAPFVDKLSDADIDALAAWFAAQPAARSANGDNALVSRGEHLSGYCKACHGMQGRPAANEWPILAGQQAAYLVKQMGLYKSGGRVNPLMRAALNQFGDSEFAALAAYYSQLEP